MSIERKSIDFRLEHPINSSFIVITLDESKFLKSTEVNKAQFLNIELILVNELVFKIDKSKEVNF